MTFSHVIQYRQGGKLLNHYLMADSIEDAERRARLWGIYGEGFEMVEQRELSEREFWQLIAAMGGGD